MPSPSPICLVTVHGIGFQRPPERGEPGYADGLHDLLRRSLGDLLGDDPERPATGGPVYVQSSWGTPPAPEKGLMRLDQPLIGRRGRIAHVALVYSDSEPLEPRLGSVTDTVARALLAHRHYTSVLGALRLLAGDVWALLHEKGATGPLEAGSSLRPRDAPPTQREDIEEILHGQTPANPLLLAHPAGPPDEGLLGTMCALEDDLATYICRNDLRERVRSFVAQALERLLARVAAGQLAGVVVNAHSQGTVACWDALCRLPFSTQSIEERAVGIRRLITAGSPIRKYVDLFAWGQRVGEMAALSEAAFQWHNYWDPKDPVADPLDPPANWRPGEDPEAVSAARPPEVNGLLVAVDPDTGTRRHFPVQDHRVDNITHSSGGGLQAHDYWNNVDEFVGPLADLLRALVPEQHPGLRVASG
jgi:hypothetical protein